MFVTEWFLGLVMADNSGQILWWVCNTVKSVRNKYIHVQKDWKKTQTWSLSWIGHGSQFWSHIRAPWEQVRNTGSEVSSLEFQEVRWSRGVSTLDHLPVILTQFTHRTALGSYCHLETWKSFFYKCFCTVAKLFLQLENAKARMNLSVQQYGNGCLPIL